MIKSIEKCTTCILPIARAGAGRGARIVIKITETVIGRLKELLQEKDSCDDPFKKSCAGMIKFCEFKARKRLC